MLAKPQILVVDDDREMLTLLQDFLSRQGYEVSIANNGKNALSFFKKRDLKKIPELVLSDVKMAPVNGLELSVTLQANHPELPVILFSAFANGGLVEASAQAGARRFLRKPFALAHLATIVKEELEK